jgi:aryl-alcohol dehydrogenase-like predicted oxidoreductase
MTTPLGLGGAVIIQDSFASGVDSVKAAYDLGVRYFDTSPGYCANESQRIFGAGLAGVGDVMVATKLGYFENPADFRSPRALRAQIEDNLQRLGRDHVDVLQVHEANWACWWQDGIGRTQITDDGSYDFAGAPVFEVLSRAKEDGLCAYYGITGNVASQMSQVLADVDVDTFLMAFNYDLAIRNAEVEAIPLAKKKAATVILGAIFYGGRLIEPHPEWITNPPEWMDENLRKKFSKLYEIQGESGLSLVELGVRFTLSQPDVSVVLVGTKNPKETEECIRAADAGPLPSDLQTALEVLGRNA